ncbi:hypothetical protein L1S32_00055 [Methanogenium sp. S4BF]|uniref:hypothetical protein n=1 Tax=Methanogenium sp. S4BF TaxID=1789226 RepID=UPI002415EFD2|nr:hypothetical protein [Methanogenium sp. S4BF]WFN34550.1 hypothetical protein L1S32_00055 [Methanogenium sp. S4BF]
MAWDDWVFGIATGGLYNLGKTTYKAGKAADQAGDALEEIADSVGEALSIIGMTFTELADELNSFVNELEDLLTTERVTPRSDDDLWDEELARLNLLRQQETALSTELEAFGEISLPTTWYEWMSFDWSGYMEYMMVLAKLNLVKNAIREILYQEPGVVPTAIYDFKEVLERFNTLEQPRIEAIMDATGDSMEEMQEILTEVHKLFVVTRWKKVTELSPVMQTELERLEATLSVYDTLIGKNQLIASQLQDPLVRIHPEEDLLSSAIQKTGKPDVKSGMVITDFGIVKESALKTTPPEKTAVGGAAPAGVVHRETEIPTGIPAVRTPAVMKTALPGRSMKEKALTARPVGETLGSVIKTPEVNAYLGGYNTVIGRIRYLERERLKIEKAAYRIKWVKIEEPGVIPKTLDEVERTINRFRTEEQPRIEIILDSMNETILESKALLENVNESLDKSQGWLDFLASYRTPILILCAISSAVVFAIMIALLVVLVKLAITI